MLKKSFLQGLMTLIPLVITIGLLIWMFNLIEGFIAPLVAMIVSPKYYYTGIGFVLFLLACFIIGSLINTWFIAKIYKQFEGLLKKMPLIKTLYGSIQDLMNFFRGNAMQNKGVVLVTIGECQFLGLVTREDFKDLPEGFRQEGKVAVFIPSSYQIGGFTLIVSRKSLRFLEMSVEDGLRYAITAGMGTKKDTPIE